MRMVTTGDLLVASSIVEAPLVSQGVCLIVHQEDESVIALMLNRPMKATPELLDNLIAMANSEGSDSSEPGRHDENAPEDGTNAMIEINSESALPELHFGGPLSGPVVAVHRSAKHAEAVTGAGVFVAAQKDSLVSLLNRNDASTRLIVGHLGWDSRQLRTEIDAGLWHVIPASEEIVFSEPSEMWPSTIRRATANSMADWIGAHDDDRARETN